MATPSLDVSDRERIPSATIILWLNIASGQPPLETMWQACADYLQTDTTRRYDIVVAHTLTMAMDLWRSRQPALIVIDTSNQKTINPLLQCIDFVQHCSNQITSLEIAPVNLPIAPVKLPIIVLVEPDHEAWAERALELGAMDYLLVGTITSLAWRKSVAAVLDYQALAQHLNDPHASQTFKAVVAHSPATPPPSDHFEEAGVVGDRQQFQADILRDVYDAVISTDMNGIIETWNNGAERVYGYTAAECIGQSISLLYGDSGNLPENLIARLLECGRYETEVVCRHKDGRIIYTDLRLSVCHDPASNITRLLGVGRDITARKQAELQVHLLRQRLDFLLNTSPAVTYSTHPQANYDCTFISQNVAQVLGYDPNEFLTNSDFWLQRLYPDDAPRVFAEISDLFDQGYLKHEYRLQHRDGHYVWIQDELVLVRDETGNPVEVVGYFSDVTERKCQEAEREQAAEQLRRYAQEVEDLYNNAPCGYHSLDAEGRFVRVNDTELRWLGYSRDDLLGKRFVDLLTVASRPTFYENFPRFLKLGQIQDLEFEFLCQDGSVLPALLNAVAVRDADGNFLYSRSMIVDIRDRKHREHALQQHAEREHLIRLIAERIRQSLDAQTIFDTACTEIRRVLHADRVGIFKFYPETNYDQGEFVAEAVTDGYLSALAVRVQDHCFGQNFAPLYAAGRYAAIANIHTAGLQPCHQEVLAQFQIQAQVIMPLLGREGLWGLLCIHQCDAPRQWQLDEIELIQILANQLTIAVQQVDLLVQLQGELAQRQQAQAELSDRNQQLAIMNEELARATRLKDEFLANMSHELRTPLNSILGMTEALQDQVHGTVNERQGNSLQIIERAGSHLLALINDILDLAKVEAGHTDLDCSVVDISRLCASSLTFVKQQAMQKQIQLRTQIPTDLPFLSVDERRIRQVLINLLNNAIKFTPKGGKITLEVTPMTAAPVASPLPEAEGLATPPPLQDKAGNPVTRYLRFAITDTGIGIDPEHIPKLFKPFSQVDSALNRQQEGTGLGLALVKRIVEMHGGNVDLTSQVGVGSCFVFTLPVPETALQPTPMTPTTLTSVSPTIPPAPSSPLTAPLILIADDNPSNITTLMAYLEARGYRTVEAQDGESALAIARAQLPDLILMDIQMPQMDGLEAIRRIRADANIASIPIIALTALAMPGDEDRCLEAGANHYVSKPVRLKPLAELVHSYLVQT